MDEPLTAPHLAAAEPPARRFRRLVEADLHGKLSQGERIELHAEPLAWLEALVGARDDILSHVRRDADRLAATADSRGYSEKRIEVGRRNMARRRFVARLDDTIADVRAMPGVAGRIPDGAAVEAMLTVAAMCRRDEDHGIIQQYADRALAAWTGGPTAKAA